MAVKRGLKLGKKSQKKKMRWTCVLTELLHKMHKTCRATPRWRWRQRTQPAWCCYDRQSKWKFMYENWGKSRPVTILGHQRGRRIFWRGTIFLKICPTQLSSGKHFAGGLRSPRAPCLWAWVCHFEIAGSDKERSWSASTSIEASEDET